MFSYSQSRSYQRVINEFLYLTVKHTNVCGSFEPLKVSRVWKSTTHLLRSAINMIQHKRYQRCLLLFSFHIGYSLECTVLRVTITYQNNSASTVSKHVKLVSQKKFKDSKSNLHLIQNKQDNDRNMQSHTCKMKIDNDNTFTVHLYSTRFLTVRFNKIAYVPYPYTWQCSRIIVYMYCLHY